MRQIQAPWTDEQVKALNEYQHDPRRGHPFTCGARVSDHLLTNKINGSYEEGRTLIAKNDGWHCPTCPYTQDWAWDAMFGRTIDRPNETV